MIFKPHLKKNCITDITTQDLKDLGVDTLLLDVDNTLSLHHSQTPAEGVVQWLRDMEKSGIKLIILSNARCSRVSPFANKLKLPFVWLAKKPLPTGYFKAKRMMDINFKTTAAVGDQLFTDMLGGHLVGIKCILVTPFKLEDKWNFKIRRRIERLFLNRYGY